MQAYEYQALTEAGATTRGVVQADSARAARSQLRDRGLLPLEVSAVERERPGFGAAGGQGRERALLLRQMSTLLAAGLPLEEVLSVLVEQADQSRSRRQLGAIRARVMEGQSLSAAMAEHPRLFPPLYSASVAAGERAGQLDIVLERLAGFAEQREEMRRSFSLALVYPVVLTVIAIAVVTGLIGFVVPRVVGVFEQASRELPWLTRSLLALSDGIANWGWLMIVILGASVMAAILALRQPHLRLRFDEWLLRLPVLGRLARSRETATLMRTLAILVGSAVPLVDALRVAGEVVVNRRIRADVEAASAQLREGISLTRALGQYDWLPPMARRLLSGGERSGELAPMLEQAARLQERDLQAASQLLLAVLQPLLILLVGAVVLYIVLAIMLPIMSMSQLLSA
ncbi:type II secretion system inner membrane protein GspF [Wenzhouxiangella sp. XN201]|uniref:type II secretion system inner membrane protein GspF n=1 Tax=Wenzhouxiangella sp. XN201 TaxID=2710755 RepID=UPI0013CA3BE7|nr:type II secretion system inner membrane protein GspF [Wenzhouxiangella sp. XN201]NEZ04802.1 type II secretion system inner membrane protein GspF [Wenzhouxiangella sp. XN201]